MSNCTHHWTVTSECPFCLRAKLDKALLDRDALQQRLDLWMRDYEANREISRRQARRIRELLARLGEPHAPDIGLPPDEVGPLKAELATVRSRHDACAASNRLHTEEKVKLQADLAAARADLSSHETLLLSARNLFDPYGDGRLNDSQSACKDVCARIDAALAGEKK